MRATIVIAAHNEGPRLTKTIESCVDACAVLDGEIVVADDASTDDSLSEAIERFPHLRVTRHEQRQGASATKDLGAQAAQGAVLVFLDGHTNPEPGALRRLVEDVERLEGQAVVTPEIAALDTESWQNDCCQRGNGYFLELERFSCGWVSLDRLQTVDVAGRQFYESPALIGCALAVSRDLYRRLHGFDPHMRLWGVEDLEFGLRCWFAGQRILHDPQAVVGHRFRSKFDNFSVPPERVLVNQLRAARRHFTATVWNDWLERARQRHQGRLTGHPEGLWARAWELFQADRASIEQERSHAMARRTRDEFWYAERFGLPWPRLGSGQAPPPRPAKFVEPEDVDASPSPSPQPKCKLTGIAPGWTSTCVNSPLAFSAQGSNLRQVQWTAAGGNPSYGTGPSFSTRWATPGDKTVSAQCGGTSQRAYVGVGQLTAIKASASTVCVNTPVTFTATGTYLNNVRWSAGGGNPNTGSGPSFTTQWNFPGVMTVTASCGSTYKSITVSVGTVLAIDPPKAVLGIDELQPFTAVGPYTDNTQWTTDPPGDPPSAKGTTFTTGWSQTGQKQIKAKCGSVFKLASAQVVKAVLSVDRTNDNDCVCYSKERMKNRPSITLTVELLGPPGTPPQKIDLSQAGDGKVTFSDPSPMVTVGAPVQVEVYGDREGSAKGSTILQATRAGAAKPDSEVKITVFRGARIYWSGTFLCDIENRGFRPDCESADPKAPYYVGTTNTISFNTPAHKRAWAPTPRVTVTKVEARLPNFELTADPLKGQPVTLGSQTKFSQTDDTGNDLIRSWKMIVGDPNAPFFTAQTREVDTRIAVKNRDVDITPQVLQQWDDDVDKAIPANTPGCVGIIRSRFFGFRSELKAQAIVVKFDTFATWQNTWLGTDAGPAERRSKGATALCAEVDQWIGSVSCAWEHWNWFTLGGDVAQGVIDSTPTPIQ